MLGRSATLLLYLPKQRYQPENESVPWQRTIIEQPAELMNLSESATLRAKADDEVPPAYDPASRMAAAETGLSIETFPLDPPYSMATRPDIADPQRQSASPT